MFNRKSKPSPFTGREPLTDAAFLESISVENTHQGLALSIRRAVAKVCGLDAQILHPTDPTPLLAEVASKRAGRDWDDIEIVFAMEEELGRSLPYGVTSEFPPFVPWRFFGLKGSIPIDFGDWIQRVVAVLGDSPTE